MKSLEQFKFWLIVVFLLGTGAGLGLFSGSHLQLRRALARDGVTTVGRVVDHSAESYSRRSSNLRLTVEFAPADRAAVKRTLAVDGSTYYPAVESGEVRVRYLPTEPERCLVGDAAVLPYQVVLGLGGLMVLAGTGLVGRFWVLGGV